MYAQALYDLAKEEHCEEQIRNELAVLDESFGSAPEFIKLLCAPNLSKDERCAVLDDSFRSMVHPYLLNCLKLLTQKGYMRQFREFCRAYKSIFNSDHGILEVSAVSAVALTEDQKTRLIQKLEQVTGNTVELLCRVDPGCLGGIRLDYEGKRLDGTVRTRLDSISNLLKNTVL